MTMTIDQLRTCTTAVSIKDIRLTLMAHGYTRHEKLDQAESWRNHGLSIVLDVFAGTRNERNALYFPPEFVQDLGGTMARHQRIIEHMKHPRIRSRLPESPEISRLR